jgi:hypothetical protein
MEIIGYITSNSGNNQFKNKNFTLAIYYYEKAIVILIPLSLIPILTSAIIAI